jgi:hypothetical protein
MLQHASKLLDELSIFSLTISKISIVHPIIVAYGNSWSLGGVLDHLLKSLGTGEIMFLTSLPA